MTKNQIKTLQRCFGSFGLAAFFIFSPVAWAQNSQGISVAGRITDAGGTPLTSNNVDFTLKVLSPLGCVLYSESFTGRDMTTSNGEFKFALGTGGAASNAYDSSTPQDPVSFRKVFDNTSPALTGLTAGTTGACVSGNYSATSGETRMVLVSFDAHDSTGVQTLLPAYSIRQSPHAMIAEEAFDAKQLGGIIATDYISRTTLPNCASGEVLKSSAGVLSCVTDVTSGSPAAATTSSLGVMQVGSGLNVASGVVSVQNPSSGDLTGTFPNLTVAKIRGTSVSATSPTASGQVLRYDGTSSYVAAFLSLADIRSTVIPGNTMFPASTCTAAQSLSWSSLTDTMVCQNVTIPKAQVTGLGTAAGLDGGTSAGNVPVLDGSGKLAVGVIPTSVGIWNPGASSSINYTAGNVGIGTTTPVQNLDVGAGAIRSGSVTIAGTPMPFAQPFVVNGQTPATFLYVDNTYNTLRIGNQGVTGINNIAFELPNGASYQDVMSLSAASLTPAPALDDAVALGLSGKRWGSLWVGTGNSIFQGNVGIGTANPSISGLDVQTNLNGSGVGINIKNNSSLSSAGTAVIVANNASAQIALRTTSTTNSGDNIGANATELYSIGTLNIASTAVGSTGIIRFETQGDAPANERMRIDQNGNVGVGTTAPSAVLSVTNPGITSDSFNVTSTNTGGTVKIDAWGNTYFWNGLKIGVNATYPTDAVLDGNGGSLVLKTSVANKHVLLMPQAGGNVGIGTVTPTTKLDVNGSVRLAMDATACAAGIAGAIRYNTPNVEYCDGTSWGAFSSGGGAATSVSAGNGTVGAPSISFSTDTGTGFYVDSSHVIGIANNGVESMRLSSSGITGTGAMTVAAGGTNQNLTLASSGTGAVNVGTGNGTGLSVIDQASAVNYVTIKGASAGNSPVIGTAGSDANINLTLTPKGTGNTIVNGNVGIGTTSPAGLFDVEQTSTASSGSVKEGQFNLLASPAAGSTANSTALVGFTNFNGPAATSAFLTGVFAEAQNSWTGTVASATGINGMVNAVNGGTITSAYGGYFQTTNTGSTITNAYGAYTGTMAGTNKWSFYASDAAAPSYFAGKVGIGITAPNSKVHIAGTDSTTVSLATEYLHLGDASQNTNGYRLIGFGYTSGAEANPNAYIGFQDTSTAGSGKGDLVFGTRNSTNDSTVPSERLRISAAGNVGVGVTSPSSNLSFSGQAAQGIGMERETTASTAGNILTVQAGGAASGGTDLAGGDLILNSGVATGAGLGNIYFGVPAGPGGTPGNSDSIPRKSFKMAYSGLGISAGSGVSADTITNFPYSSLDLFGNQIIYGLAAGSTYGGSLIFVNQDGALGWGNHITTVGDEMGKIQFDLVNSAWTTDVGVQIDAVTPNVTSGSAAATLNFKTMYNGTLAPRMTIYNGNVGIGTTTPGGQFEVNSGAAGATTGVIINTTSVGANTYESFKANGTVIGSITSAAGANVAFNTTSDIRLKGGFQPVIFPLKTLNEIEVSNFYYTADPAHRMDGFKAQQLYEVLPYAVVKPEKDVDDEGHINPWLADYSKVVPLITAAMQELYRMVLGIENRQAIQDREIASIHAENDQLRLENAEMKARLDKIEKMIGSKGMNF